MFLLEGNRFAHVNERLRCMKETVREKEMLVDHVQQDLLGSVACATSENPNKNCPLWSQSRKQR